MWEGRDRACEVVEGRHLVAVILWLAWVLVPGLGHAAARRSVAVEVAPAGDWRAEALARALGADLTDDQLAIRAAPACGGPCSDDALRAAKLELVVRAALTSGS